MSPEDSVQLLTKVAHIMYAELSKRKNSDDIHRLDIPKFSKVSSTSYFRIKFVYLHTSIDDLFSQVVKSLEDSMDVFGFTCRELHAIKKILSEVDLEKDHGSCSYVDDVLADTLTKSLYF